MRETTNEAPFFIVGNGRSGTTLVRTMLAAHSRLAVPPETHYMKWIDDFGANQAEAPDDFDNFWTLLCQRIQFRDLNIDPARVIELVDARGARNFHNVFDAILAAYAEKMGKPRVGEKTPGHYFYIDRIFRWWPDARIIVVRRDPRATISSQLLSPWVTQELHNRKPGSLIMPTFRLFHVAHHAKLWKEAYGRYLSPTRDPRFHFISYEDLVADPAARMADVAEFLSERFEPGMIDSREAVDGATAESRKPEWHAFVREHEAKSKAAISTKGLSKWRDSLSIRERAVIEAICGSTMERFGYKPDLPRIRRIYPAVLGFAVLRASRVEHRLRRGLNWMRKNLRKVQQRA